MRYAATRGVTPGRRGRWTYDIGLGVRAEVGGCDVLVGSDRLLDRGGVDLSPATGLAKGGSRIYVAVDGRLGGVIGYDDPIRREAGQVVGALRDEHGMEIHLLTGDKTETAHAVGRRLGIDADNVHGELFPEDKAAVLQGLRARPASGVRGRRHQRPSRTGVRRRLDLVRRRDGGGARDRRRRADRRQPPCAAGSGRGVPPGDAPGPPEHRHRGGRQPRRGGRDSAAAPAGPSASVASSRSLPCCETGRATQSNRR